MFLKESDDIELLVTYLSDNTFNLYSFMYARRINEAWKKCANGVIAPNSLACATAITNPRTYHLTADEEKIFYRTAIVLTEGYYVG